MARRKSEIEIQYTATNADFNASIKDMNDEIKTLNKTFSLQKEQMGDSATEADKLAAKIENPKFDWEIPYLQRTNELVFTNTFSGLEYYLKTMNEHGIRPEFEVYDVGMINNIAYFINKGLVKQPVYLQFVMGILGGIPATVDNLVYLVKTAREQIGDFVWSCAAAGRSQMPLVTAALTMGGNARVGLEDNLYLKPGVLAKSSAEQVIQIKEIAERLGLEIANSEEARQILALKGGDKVNF